MSLFYGLQNVRIAPFRVSEMSEYAPFFRPLKPLNARFTVSPLPPYLSKGFGVLTVFYPSFSVSLKRIVFGGFGGPKRKHGYIGDALKRGGGLRVARWVSYGS